jgi:phosphoglucosamine mutase
MQKQLFGTDGIRGVAGQYPLDPATVFAFGLALADDARHAHANPEILIGADTRESSSWIAEMVAGGLARGGAAVRYAGVITTPGVAYLTRSGPFVAGVMISASHNPYQDNGLKVFGHSGFKLPDAEEHAVERDIFSLLEAGVSPTPARLTVDENLESQYIEYLLSTVTARLDGVRLIVDCGNGASYRLAPELFRRLGAQVTAMEAAPNGRNINLNCGAMHLAGLQRAVLAAGASSGAPADFGVAFDGDADRAIFVAPSGRIVDGDSVLLAAGRALQSAGRLPGDIVVATVMSNLGLQRALERHGIRLLRAAVGDKYVLEEMVRTGAMLGGEQSGHVIFREYATTGDGMLTALRLFEIARCCGMSLDELTADFRAFPQKLVNIPVRQKKDFADMPDVAREISLLEQRMGSAGRVLVRYSGTELLARVMVEASEQELVDTGTARIADAIRREIGV